MGAGMVRMKKKRGDVTFMTAIQDKVPMHMWTSHKPDVSHLRVFGSISYANIPKKVCEGKLEVTSVKCRLLGRWANESKATGWRTSRHVH
jgi:hypothetical protein